MVEGSFPANLPGGHVGIIVESKKQSDAERVAGVKKALAHKHPEDKTAYHSVSDSSAFGSGKG